MKKIMALMSARLKEFYREKGGLGWNFIFPIFIIIGFTFIFDKDQKDYFKIALINTTKAQLPASEFYKWDQLKFIELSEQEALNKVGKHQVDMAMQVSADNVTYWINSTSKNGLLIEKLLSAQSKRPVLKKTIEKGEVPYIDWVLPGILAMNVMFSCLWGVGFIIVKYRQNGFLKRLQATPIKPYHYLLAQIGSRYVIAFVVTSIVYVGSKWLIDFNMAGSYLDLIIVYTVGITCLISVGLVVASRTSSKELADGVMNIASWPMMMLSGVWFSMDGASEGMKMFSQMLPLTHLVDASRAIMVDGAGLMDVWPNIRFMLIVSVVLVAISSWMFKWGDD